MCRFVGEAYTSPSEELDKNELVRLYTVGCGYPSVVGPRVAPCSGCRTFFLVFRSCSGRVLRHTGGLFWVKGFLKDAVPLAIICEKKCPLFYAGDACYDRGAPTLSEVFLLLGELKSSPGDWFEEN